MKMDFDAAARTHAMLSEKRLARNDVSCLQEIHGKDEFLRKETDIRAH